MTEDVNRIRDLEQQVLQDAKKVNSILPIKQFLKDEEQSKDVRMVALHALRRIFIHLIETNRFASTTSKGTEGATNQYRQWLVQQLDSYLQNLREIVSSSDVAFQAPAIRTTLEFVRREHLVTSKKASTEKESFAFGVNTYQSLMEAILNMSDIDVEILLMVREEVFSKPDCTYYALLVLKDTLDEKKESIDIADTPSAEIVRLMQNSLDLLRMIQVPDEETLSSKKNFLAGAKGLYIDDDGLNDEGDSDDEESDEEEDVKETKLAAGFTNAKKRVHAGKSEAPKKKPRNKLSRAEQLKTLSCYRKAFSKAWLALLRMPLTNNQHKLVLKHLPDYVMGQLDEPLLLADYLTRSYEQGGVVAVLALESLFQLIVQKNLDYPNFFVSLYRLCTAEVFSAKYRSKFMKLLSASLKSTNLPAYLVAAFLKRLSQLALRVPAPSALFCLAQVTWLLRRHQQCMPLLHRSVGSRGTEADGVDLAEGGKSTGKSASSTKSLEFDALEEFNLETANAMQSSLWELEALSQHHLHSVATFAKSLETATSTSSGVDAPYLRVEDFIEHSYAALMETELASAKKHSAMAYKQPAKLLEGSDFISKCFGSA